MQDEVLIFCADARTASTTYVSVPKRGLVRWMMREVEESIAIQLSCGASPLTATGPRQTALAVAGLAASRSAILRELRLVPALQHRDVHMLERAAAAAEWGAGALTSPSGVAGAGMGLSARGGKDDSGNGGGSSARTGGGRRGAGGGGGGDNGGSSSTMHGGGSGSHRDLREAGIRPHITARRGCIIFAMGPLLAAAILSSKLLVFVGSGSDDDLRPVLARIAEVFSPAAISEPNTTEPTSGNNNSDNDNMIGSGPSSQSLRSSSSPSSSASEAPSTFNNRAGGNADPSVSLSLLLPVLHPAVMRGTFLNPSSPSYFPLLSWELFCLEALLSATVNHYSRLVERAEASTAEATRAALKDQEDSVVKWGAFAGLAYRCLGRSARGVGRLLRCQCRCRCKCSRPAMRCSCCRGGGSSSPSSSSSYHVSLRHSRTSLLSWQWLTRDSMGAASNIIRLGQVGSSLKGLRSAVYEVQRAIAHVLDDADTATAGDAALLTEHGNAGATTGAGVGAAGDASAGGEALDPDALSPLSAFVFPLSRRAILQQSRASRAATTAAAASRDAQQAAEQGEQPPQQQEDEPLSSQVEVLFEAYLSAADSLLRRSRMLIDEVESAEGHSRLLMAVSQNHIWSAQVVLSSVSGLLACALVVAAYFGMNLGNASADFSEPHGNWLAVVITMSSVVIVGSVLAAAAVFKYLDAGGAR